MKTWIALILGCCISGSVGYHFAPKQSPNLKVVSLRRADLKTIEHVAAKLQEYPDQQTIMFNGGEITPAQAVCTSTECAIRVL